MSPRAEAGEMPILQIDRINVSYGDVQVLREASVNVLPGEVVTVIGPNGAGKSTLLKAVANLLPPAPKAGPGGGIRFLGRPIWGLPPEETVALGIALVPEGGRVFAEMSVLDNLRMGSYLPEARARREQTLEEVFGLFPRLKERPGQRASTLSGGERQMLAIGRALMSRPGLLLLDEPCLGLQPILVERTYRALQEINRRGVAVLLAEQNVQFSLEISRRAYVLENGRVAAEGKAADLLADEHIKKFYLAL